MRQQITNNQLIALDKDVQKQMNESPAFFFFNKTKIDALYQKNTLLFKIINERMAGFVKKYVQHDEEGKPLTEEKNGEKVYVFATEADREQYLAEQQEFLSLTIHIEL